MSFELQIAMLLSNVMRGNGLVRFRGHNKSYHPAFRGLPPFAPFARAAAAFAGELTLPARRASSLIQALVPNTPFITSRDRVVDAKH